MIYIKAAFLAFVEGITEFLPISSTGHMILFDEFIKLSNDEQFAKAFMVVVQLPAILAVVVYFWKDLWPFAAKREETVARFVLWGKILLAFFPAVVLGAIFADMIEEKLFNPITVALALLVGGILLIVLERRSTTGAVPTARALTAGMALMIGLFQCIAMIPGTSRSAATIIGAMALGASRLAAAEFSFFLAIPTMVGATGYTIMKHGLNFTSEQWMVTAVGSVVAFGVAYAAIAGFMSYIRRNNFKPFGYYRIALGLIVLAYFLLIN